MIDSSKKYYSSATAARGFTPMVSDEMKEVENLLRGMSYRDVGNLVRLLDSRLATMSRSTESFIRMIYSDMLHRGEPSVNLAMLYNCTLGDAVVKKDGRWVLKGIHKDSYSNRIVFSWDRC